jgi:hypothetical protein
MIISNHNFFEINASLNTQEQGKKQRQKNESKKTGL